MNTHRLSYLYRFIHNSATFACLAVFTACLQFHLFAAEKPPDPPYVGTPPDPCAWIIDVQQKKPRAGPPADPRVAYAYKRAQEISPRILRVTVEKSGKNLYEETSYENQKVGVMYIYNGWVIYRPMNWPVDKALALPVGYRDSPVKGGLGSDFPDLDWVRPEVYVGIQSYGGRQCYYYEDKTHGPLKGGDTLAAPVNGVHAWIDMKSRLPLAVEDAAVLKKYTYRVSDATVQLTGIYATAYEQAAKVRHGTGLYGGGAQASPSGSQ